MYRGRGADLRARSGALVASRRPGNPIGWILSRRGRAPAALGGVRRGLRRCTRSSTRPGSLPAGVTAAWVADVGRSIPGPLRRAALLLPAAVPRRSPARRVAGALVAWLSRRRVGRVLAPAIAPHARAGALGMPQRPPTRRAPRGRGARAARRLVGSAWHDPRPGPRGGRDPDPAASPVPGRERQQLKWIACAAALIPIGVVAVVVRFDADPERRPRRGRPGRPRLPAVPWRPASRSCATASTTSTS